VPDPLTGRVLQFMAGVYRIHTSEGTFDCSLRGKAKRDAGERVAIGDLVTFERLEDESCRITEVLPRESRLSRHSLAKRREQVLAANVDQVAAVFSVARPEPDIQLLDRLLAVAELHDLASLIVVNKTDLTQNEKVPPEIVAYAALGYPVLPMCAKTGAGLDVLQEMLAGRITVFTGPSGVGKTSILNAILPDLDLRVGAVGERSGRGKHTTSAGLLIPLPDGGYLAASTFAGSPIADTGRNRAARSGLRWTTAASTSTGTPAICPCSRPPRAVGSTAGDARVVRAPSIGPRGQAGGPHSRDRV